MAERYMLREEAETFLKSRGWQTWYHPDYWVNSKVVLNPNVQDCTNYGMTWQDAYEFETSNLPPVPPSPLGLSQMTGRRDVAEHVRNHRVRR